MTRYKLVEGMQKGQNRQSVWLQDWFSFKLNVYTNNPRNAKRSERLQAASWGLEKILERTRAYDCLRRSLRRRFSPWRRCVTVGALDLHARSTTLEIKICSCTRGQKGRTVALRLVQTVKRDPPSGEPFYLMKRKMQNIIVAWAVERGSEKPRP